MLNKLMLKKSMFWPLAFFLIASLFAITQIFYKSILIPATLVSYANFAIILFLITFVGIFKNIIIRIFFFYHLLTLVLPILIMIIFFDTNAIQQYLLSTRITEEDVFYSNLIILYFDIFLIVAIIIFSKFKYKMINKPFQYYLFSEKKFLVIIVLLVIAYSSKLYLVSIGAWFVFMEIDLTQYPFVNTVDILAQLDTLVLFYFLFRYKHDSLPNKFKIIMLITIVLSITFAVISTSKGKLFMILIPVLLILWYTKYKKAFILLILLFFINMTTLFEFMMYNRLNNNQTIVANILNFQTQKKETKSSIEASTVFGRLNYQFIVAKVIKRYDDFPDQIKADYLNNVLGLMPRFIWQDKPKIGLDQNEIGREIGALGQTDYTTSVGISPVGEAYYEMGLPGIVLIPFLFGFIIMLLVKLFNNHYWIGFLLSYFLALTLINTSSVLLIPSLLKILIIFYFFALGLNDKYIGDEKRLRFIWKRK